MGAFKDRYRTALDELPLPVKDDVCGEEEKEVKKKEVMERIVAEANVAFVLNMRLFEELDVMGGIPDSKVRPLDDAVGYFTDCISLQEERRIRRNQSDEADD